MQRHINLALSEEQLNTLMAIVDIYKTDLGSMDSDDIEDEGDHSEQVRVADELDELMIAAYTKLEREKEADETRAAEVPLDTPSLDTSFHDHEMDVD